MLRKFFRIFLIFLEIAIVCVLLATGAFFWRLQKAPIEINEYIPFLIEIATSSNPSTKYSIDSALIEWGGIRRPIDLVAKNFKAIDENDIVVMSVPEISMTFSLRALLRGTVAPKTLAITHPYLHLTINREGEIDEATPVSDDDTEEKGIQAAYFPIRGMIEHLEKEDYLTEFSLIDAEIKITDDFHQAEWSMPAVNLTYTRRHRKNKLKGSLSLKTKTQPLVLDISGEWKPKGKDMHLIVSVNNLAVTNSTTAQKYPYLKNFTTPINLRLSLSLDLRPIVKSDNLKDLRNIIQRIEFSITGKEGIINLPAPVIARFNLKNFAIQGTWYASGNNFDIPEFELVMQNGGKAKGSFIVKGIGQALDEQNMESIEADLIAQAENIPVDMLPDYWPASIGADVHAWVKENMNGGIINDGKFKLHFVGLKDEGGIDADMIDGIVNVENTQVTYMDDMPPVESVSGQVRLTRDIITIIIDKGNTHSVNILNGTLKFVDLTQKISTGLLDLNLQGQVPDALKILDSPALQITREIGIQPEKTTGMAKGNLKLEFPLGDAFESEDQLKIKSTAEVRNADVNDIILGYGVQDAILHMDLDGKNLKITGTALIYSSSAKYTILKTFDNTKEVTAEIKLQSNINDRARQQMDISDFLLPPSMIGVLKTDLTLTLKNDNTGTVYIESDLTDATINMVEIGWQKPAKTESKASITMSLKDGEIIETSPFQITDAQNTIIRGKLFFDEAHSLRQVDVDPIRAGRTNAKARMRFFPDNVLRVGVTGTELDLSLLLSGPPKSQGSSKSNQKKPSAISEKDHTIFIDAAVDKLWLSQSGFAENNAFSAVYTTTEWKKIEALGYVGEQKVPARLTLYPNIRDENYALNITSDDAGHTLKTMDYISSVKGGKLIITGILNPQTGISGDLLVTDFYLQERPVLSRLLMLTSLTGIMDILKGEGLFFSKAEVPFEIDEESLTLSDGVISGPSLGITLSGKYFRETGFINLRGSLVPFYTLNSFLGKIPVIGRIFSGEKGGGLIAPTYTIRGKLPSPNVSVNGFSALAPGAVRQLLSKMSSDDGDLSKTNLEDVIEEVETIEDVPLAQPAPLQQKEVPQKEVELFDTLEKH